MVLKLFLFLSLSLDNSDSVVGFMTSSLGSLHFQTFISYRAPMVSVVALMPKYSFPRRSDNANEIRNYRRGNPYVVALIRVAT